MRVQILVNVHTHLHKVCANKHGCITDRVTRTQNHAWRLHGDIFIFNYIHVIIACQDHVHFVWFVSLQREHLGAEESLIIFGSVSAI